MNAPVPVFHVRIPAPPAQAKPGVPAPTELQRVFQRLARAPEKRAG